MSNQEDAGSTRVSVAKTALVHFGGGWLAGMAGVLAGQPFDTLKVRLQLKNKLMGQDTATTLLHDFNKRGVLGFYRGIAPPLIAVGLQKSVAFGVYGVALNAMKKDPITGDHSTLQRVAAGVCGGVANSLFLSPIDQVKIAQQIDSGKEPVRKTVARICKANGGFVRGLFGAYPSVLYREIVGYSMYFSSYEVIRSQVVRQQPQLEDHPVLVSLFAGGLTGMCMWGTYYPLDIIKSHQQWQVARNVPVHERTDLLGSIKTIAARGNSDTLLGKLGPFYRGWVVAVCRAFPAHAMCLTVSSVFHSLVKGE